MSAPRENAAASGSSPPAPLHVLDRGEVGGGATPVLLLHGFTGSSDAWDDDLIDRLAADRPVLAPDLPGHGRSPLPPEVDRSGGGMRWVLDRLIELLDSRGIDRADWVGYSMGGRIALAGAVRHPDRVRRVVLESASPGLATEEDRVARRTADEELARRIEERGVEWFVDYWMSLPLFATQRALPEPVRRRERARRLGNSPEGLAASLRTIGTGAQPSYWSRLGEVSAPALLLTGSRDEQYDRIADRMAAEVPSSQRRSVPDAGHTVHLEAPHEWLQAVASFLDDPVS